MSCSASAPSTCSRQPLGRHRRVRCRRVRHGGSTARSRVSSTLAPTVCSTANVDDFRGNPHLTLARLPSNVTMTLEVGKSYPFAVTRAHRFDRGSGERLQGGAAECSGAGAATP